jgi:hypothetical protein
MLSGTITGLVRGEAAKVSLDVGGNKMVVIITRESADESGLGARKRPRSSRPPA